jgi:hypothetical protein
MRHYVALSDDGEGQSDGSRARVEPKGKTEPWRKENVGKVIGQGISERAKAVEASSASSNPTRHCNDGHPFYHPPCLLVPAHFSRCRCAQKGPKISSHSPPLCLQSARHWHLRQLPASSKSNHRPPRTHRRCQCAVLDRRVEGADKRFFPWRSRECHRGESQQ